MLLLYHYLRCVHCFSVYYPLPSVHNIVAIHYLRCVHCFSEYYPLPSVHNIVAIYCTVYTLPEMCTLFFHHLSPEFLEQEQVHFISVTFYTLTARAQ